MTQPTVAHNAAAGLPVVLVVDAEQQARTATQSALVRRFGADYRVMAADSAEAGGATLERLARQGAEVALIAADLKLPGMDGVDFLEGAHALHPDASRALLVPMDQHGARIPVGERRSPSTHELRDALTRNTVPFGFYAVDSEDGRRLVREYGIDLDRLPAVIFHDGSVRHQPN